jgi:glycosyltransferase involved in cell wall biosynthesis
MKILYCNKYNFPFSGTESYLFEAMRLMRSHGQQAALFSMADRRGEATAFDEHFMPAVDFKGSKGWLHQVGLAANAIYSREARRRIRGMIADFQPDVAHVRNVYHHLSPSILWELKAQAVPVLYHLNDFKVLCPSYNLVSRGKACEACKGGRFWNMLHKKCYPGLAERMTLVAEAYFHRMIGTYRNCVDCFLAPSQFVRDKFVEHGWDPSKFEVLHHFQSITPSAPRKVEGGPILYFGRLSPEKGVEDLLRAMQRLPHFKLVIAGDGPERGRLRQLSVELGLSNVEFAGQLGEAELEQAIADSRFTVLPSHAYETLGKTILESHARARAVVASDMGSRRELIEDGKTGILYETGDVTQLAAAIELLSSRPELADEMGRAGQAQVRKRFTADSHYKVLISLYERLAKGSACPSAAGKTAAAQGLERSSLLSVGRETSFPPRRPVRPVRVAFIGGRGVVSKYSGIETYYEEVGKRLTGMGHQVTAYCRAYFTPETKRHEGMDIVRLPTLRSKHLETPLHTLMSTLHVMMQPCDIVHYHALGPALFSFLPRLAGRRTLVTVQGLDWQRKKWGSLARAILQLGERAAVHLPNRTTVVSHTLQQHYWNRHRVNTSYIPNGGLLRDRPSPKAILQWGLEAGNYILFLGRFSPEKGGHLLIEAHERLDTNVKLVMAGGANYRDAYAREMCSHASERIRIMDWVSGMVLDELLANAMLFVLPSEIEGLSLALLDAMGAGLCVVASDLPENREAMEGAGFTFRRDDASDLADRLKFLIANPAVREAAGAAARQRVRERYQWESIALEIEQEYYRAMGWTSPEVVMVRKPSGSVIGDSAKSRSGNLEGKRPA